MKVNLRSEFWETTFFARLHLFSCSYFSNNVFGDFELSHARFSIFIGISSYWMESVSLLVSRSITVLNEDFEYETIRLAFVWDINGTSYYILFIEDGVVFFAERYIHVVR